MKSKTVNTSKAFKGKKMKYLPVITAKDWPVAPTTISGHSSMRKLWKRWMNEEPPHPKGKKMIHVEVPCISPFIAWNMKVPKPPHPKKEKVD